MLPDAVQVADPFHVVRVANKALDECRRRVQNETARPSGPQDRSALPRPGGCSTWPPNGSPTTATSGCVGLLAAGDPKGEVKLTWHAKEVVRQIYDHTDPTLAEAWVDEIIRDFADGEMPLEVRRLGRTISRWRDQIVAWHRSHVSQRADRSRQQPREARQAGGVRVAPLPQLPASAPCSTPADPTGTSSTPSPHHEIRRAVNRQPSCGALGRVPNVATERRRRDGRQPHISACPYPVAGDRIVLGRGSGDGRPLDVRSATHGTEGWVMGVFNGMFPIAEGKEDAARAFAAETIGARKADFDALQARSNITRETWAMQETPMGSFMLVWFEGDVEKTFGDLASDNSEFATWFRAQVKDVTGVDLAAPLPGPLPDVLVNWHS